MNEVKTISIVSLSSGILGESFCSNPVRKNRRRRSTEKHLNN